MGYIQSAAIGQNSITHFTSLIVALPNPSKTGNSIIVDVSYALSSGASGAGVGMFDLNGNSYARAAQAILGAAGTGECWYATNINVATDNPIRLTVTWTGSGGFKDLVIAIHEYSPLLASPFDATGHATGSGTGTITVTASLTTGYDVELLHGFAGSWASVNVATLTGGQPINFTQRQTDDSFTGTSLSFIATFDCQFSQPHPASAALSVDGRGGLIGSHNFGVILVAFKVPISPLSPGSAWLMLNEPGGIGYVDRTTYLQFDGSSSHSFTQILRQRGTAEVPLIVHAGDAVYTPLYVSSLEGCQVFLYDQNPGGSTMVFAGTIDKVTFKWHGSSGEYSATFSCVSFEQCFDALLVPPQAYFYEKAGDIFTNLLNTVAYGVPVVAGTITGGTGTGANFVINTLVLNWDRLSDVFNQLATAAGCVWGVDLTTLTIYFKPPNTTPSPYTVTQSQMEFDSEAWQSNRQDYRNRQIVRISLDAFANSAELFPFTSLPASGITFTLMRPAEQITFAWFTKNTQNSATGTLSSLPSPGDTVTIGYPQTGSIYNWAPNAPYYVGQIIIDSANNIQKCTVGNSPGGTTLSHSSAGPIGSPTGPSYGAGPTYGFNPVTGGTTNDGAIVWTCLGLSGAGGLGGSVYKWVAAGTMDNTQWGQVVIGLTPEQCAYNLCQAINADQSQTNVGNVYSWPTWENPLVNCQPQAGASATITIVNKSADDKYIASLSATGSAFAWSATETSGGSTVGGTVVLQVASQGSGNTSNLYYTPGSLVVSLKSIPSGVSLPGSVQIQYTRYAGDCIVCENTAAVLTRAAIENGTGKYQQIVNDTSITSNTLGLQNCQATLAAFDVIPISFSFVAWKPGLALGQLLTITLTGGPANLAALVNGGTYLINEITAELFYPNHWMDQTAVPGGGHYRYTITVINVQQIFSYLEFWAKLASGGGGGGAASVIAGGVSPGGSSTPVATGETTITPSAGTATLDLTFSINRIVLTAAVSPFTVAAPGVATAGSEFVLSLEQDATGGHPVPGFSNAAGGFVSNTQSQVEAFFDGSLSTTCNITFLFRASGLWEIKGLGLAGIALS